MSNIFIPLEEKHEDLFIYDPDKHSGFKEYKERLEELDVPILNSVPRSPDEIVEIRRQELERSLKKTKVNLVDDKQRLRSRIHTFLPKELLAEVNEICNREGGGNSVEENNNRKTKEVSQVLRKYKIPFIELGTGTNRKAVLIDGYVFKFALDSWGKRDNANEYAMSDILQPFVVKVYETNDLVCVTEYITLVTRDEFKKNKPTVVSILSRLAEEYLLGDVGYDMKNFANWGYRDNGQYVILDFAYIHRIQGHELYCTKCEDRGYLKYDSNFFFLNCTSCGERYSFSEVRAKITTEHELKEINDVKDISFQLRTSEELFDINISDEDLKKLNKENKKKEGRNNMKNNKNHFTEVLINPAKAQEDFDNFLDSMMSDEEIPPVNEDVIDQTVNSFTGEQVDRQVAIKNDPSILDQITQIGVQHKVKMKEQKDELISFLSGESKKKDEIKEIVDEPGDVNLGSVDDLIDFAEESQDMPTMEELNPGDGLDYEKADLYTVAPKYAYRKQFGMNKKGGKNNNRNHQGGKGKKFKHDDKHEHGNKKYKDNNSRNK